jgi:hypothetical protein
VRGNYETDPKKFNLDLRCPGCGHLVRAIPETQAVYDISVHSDQMAHLVARCPRKHCDVLFVRYDRLNDCVDRVFPFPENRAETLHSAIPAAIREDVAEARRCWFGGSNKGVVVLSRRAMQSIALDKGASGDKLADQIASLFRAGQITKSLHDAAHEVRFFGNFGAHPRDDGLDAISDSDAKAVMGIVEQLLTDLYVRPHETQQLTAKRKGPGV